MPKKPTAAHDFTDNMPKSNSLSSNVSCLFEKPNRLSSNLIMQILSVHNKILTEPSFRVRLKSKIWAYIPAMHVTRY